ncbi:unnamed protein product [Meloidogyne enterolobii]|uniref:Uncharacterized protein n=1 Tax=Meloidogyne enterolobii TaxID=390850 RepID=A0ACB0XQY3_MELEN
MIPNSLSQQQMPPIIPPAPISSNLPLYKQHSSFQNTVPSQLYCIRQPATLPTSYKSNSLPRRRVKYSISIWRWRVDSSTSSSTTTTTIS